MLAKANYAGAIVLFQEILDGDPDNPVSWDQIGWAIKDFRPSDALRYFDHALQLRPDFLNAWIGRGMAVSSQPQTTDDAEALRCFERAIEIDPRCAQAWFLKGTALGFLGREDEAEVARQRARELDPRMFGPSK